MTEKNNDTLDGEVQLPHQPNEIKPDDIVEHEQIEPNDKEALKEIAPPPPAIKEEDLPVEYHQPDPPAKIRKGPVAKLRELFKLKSNK